MSEPGSIAIGVDVGGSGIKGAAVDVSTGRLASDRHRILTPQPATPQACLAVIARIVKAIWRDLPEAKTAPIGIGVPCVVVRGVTTTAANIDPAWIGFDADRAAERVLGRPVRMVNDADAAGVAEMHLGAGAGRTGTVLVLTLGTGVGSALFVDGVLVPNTELGHMEIRGRDAERRSAAVARVRRGLSWKAWAEDLDEHLNAIHRLFSPDLYILGGGVSKNADKFVPRLTVPAEIVPAALRNEAGIVGAAMFAAEHLAPDGLRIAGARPAGVAAGEPTQDEVAGIEPEAMAAARAGAEPETEEAAEPVEEVAEPAAARAGAEPETEEAAEPVEEVAEPAEAGAGAEPEAEEAAEPEAEAGAGAEPEAEAGAGIEPETEGAAAPEAEEAAEPPERVIESVAVVEIVELEAEVPVAEVVEIVELEAEVPVAEVVEIVELEAEHPPREAEAIETAEADASEWRFDEGGPVEGTEAGSSARPSFEADAEAGAAADAADASLDIEPDREPPATSTDRKPPWEDPDQGAGTGPA